MDRIIEYFATIPSLHRTIMLVGGITFFWIIESIMPFFPLNYNKWKHAGTNFFFTITTILVNFPLAFLLVKASDWAQNHSFGVLYLLPKIPNWAFAIIGLLLMDLIGAYFVHWTQHKVKWMWKFHLIHHSDTNIDTTSANRHHPGESVFRLLFTILAVIIIGAPMWLVFMYQFLSVLLSQFNHANLILPKWLDMALSYIIVTPDIHHVHHHYQLPYTDSNYGNIFSVWDRLFGTLLSIDRSKLIYGIDTHMAPSENAEIKPLLKIPFQEYRAPTKL
jgi:sterol desaturase/sphingolipid hydroxylase (fatty acid hydroxylase superfamily)